MIDYTTGNILKDDAEALVNTVNTVGVMGKGIALQFKRRFPGNYEAYRNACRLDEITPGRMFVWHTGELDNPQYVINFPTKRHWKGRSRLEDIESGLKALRHVLLERRIESVAVPPLGCGNGGLSWSLVRALIEQYLHDVGGIRVVVYEPAGAPPPASMPAHPRTPRLTPHRAAILAAFARYLQPGFTLGRLEAQKLLYFLQLAGAPYAKLRFSKGTFGPYSQGINHVLDQVEGHFIRGFGDAAVHSEIRLLDGAAEQAEAILADPGNRAFREAVETVADLTAGFDDAFGLELLASVHWVATHEASPARNASEATRLVHEWSARKSQRYDAAQVRAAWQRLERAGLVHTTEPEDHQEREASPDFAPPVAAGDLRSGAL